MCGPLAFHLCVCLCLWHSKPRGQVAVTKQGSFHKKSRNDPWKREREAVYRASRCCSSHCKFSCGNGELKSGELYLVSRCSDGLCAGESQHHVLIVGRGRCCRGDALKAILESRKADFPWKICITAQSGKDRDPNIWAPRPLKTNLKNTFFLLLGLFLLSCDFFPGVPIL